ncbi:MAG: CsbD family protein [Asticcacaulis sp.]
MNRNRIEGAWDQVRGHVQKTWGKLSNDDLDQIEGNRKILSGKIQERYGIAQDEAELQIRRWNDEADDLVDADRTRY